MSPSTHTYTHSPSNRIRPDYEDALMGVATLLGDTGRMEEGLQFMNRAVKAAGENPNVYNNLGAYLLRLGRLCYSVRKITITIAKSFFSRCYTMNVMY